MIRREFAKRIVGLGTAFSAGSLLLPSEVKSQILKPLVNEYCRSYWDSRVLQGITAAKKLNPKALLGDTHLHSTHSDGKYSVLQLLSRARMLSLDYLVLTEHITPEYYDVESPLSSMKDQVASSKILRDAGIEPPATYPAVEISTKEGHIIAIFPKAYFDAPDFPREFRSAFSICGDRFMPAQWVIGRIRKLGGKSIVPHPGMKRRSQPFGVSLENLENDLAGVVDGIEDRNSGNAMNDEYGKRFGLSSMGASDDHFKALMGTSVTAYDSKTHNDLTEALAVRATRGIETTAIYRPLLKASLFYYSFLG